MSEALPIVLDEKVHVLLGGSSADRWLECAQSPQRSAGLPDFQSSYAAEGSAAHALAERCLLSGDQPDIYLGTEITVERSGMTFEVDQEMVDGVNLYLDAVLGDAGERPNAILKVEQHVRLDWIFPGLAGTQDAELSEPHKRCTIYDFKYGAGKAVEPDCAQLRYYGLGSLLLEDYAEIELVIVQPRKPHPSGRVRRVVIPSEDLMEWGINVLRPGAAATTNPDALAVPGDHCGWCRAKSRCPEFEEYIHQIAISVYPDDDPLAPSLLENAEIGRLLAFGDKVKLINAYFDEIKAEALARALKGEKIPGHKLVLGKRAYSWTPEFAEEVPKLLGEDAYVKKLVTVAQSRALFKKKKIAFKDSDPEKVVTSQKPTLVEESDERAEHVVRSAAEIYNDEPIHLEGGK